MHIKTLFIAKQYEDVELLNDSQRDEIIPQPPIKPSIGKRNATVPLAIKTKELPHKKRLSSQTTPPTKLRAAEKATIAIPSKIIKKEPPKRLQPEVKVIQVSPVKPKLEEPELVCEICSLVIGSQLDFFRHLKLHYEPATLQPVKVEPTVVKKSSPVVVAPVVVATPSPDRSKRLRVRFRGFSKWYCFFNCSSLETISACSWIHANYTRNEKINSRPRTTKTATTQTRISC